MPPNPASRRRIPWLLALLVCFAPACAGQDLARQEGIRFRGSRFASFSGVPPGSALYRQSLSDALALTGIPEERVTRLPRVLRGTSFLVDPPYLGRTAYADGSIFVWEGTEAPLRLVLTHEMIHWVLFEGGEAGLARDEAFVERLCESVDTARRDDPAAETWPTGGDRASEARWRDVDASDRNRERHRRGSPGYDEPDDWALAWERSRASVPWHPTR